MDIGYTRVSAKTQNLARQLATMRERGIEERFLFRDVASGKNFDRPGYLAMKSVIRAGDCLYVDALDRLGRDYESIIREWKEITRVRRKAPAFRHGDIRRSKLHRKCGFR